MRVEYENRADSWVCWKTWTTIHFISESTSRPQICSFLFYPRKAINFSPLTGEICNTFRFATTMAIYVRMFKSQGWFFCTLSRAAEKLNLFILPVNICFVFVSWSPCLSNSQGQPMRKPLNRSFLQFFYWRKITFKILLNRANGLLKVILILSLKSHLQIEKQICPPPPLTPMASTSSCVINLKRFSHESFTSQVNKQFTRTAIMCRTASYSLRWQFSGMYMTSVTLLTRTMII